MMRLKWFIHGWSTLSHRCFRRQEFDTLLGFFQILNAKTILPELTELYQQNNDLVGWICVEDTNINYPVMQTVDNPNYYLKRGFDREYSSYGCPYVQEDCDVLKPSDNLVIYGHHMNNGSMFADLEKFKDKDFWQEHKTITFSTLTDRNEYEILAGFQNRCLHRQP